MRTLKVFLPLVTAIFLYFNSSAQTDLAIAINGSGSIDATEFQLQKDAISNCVANFPRDGSVGFTLIQYAANTTTVHVPYMTITAGTDIAAIQASISAINQISGLTNSGDGIIAAANEILNNGTAGFNKVVVLATDGSTSSGTDFSTAVSTIQAAGINDFGVIAIDVMSVLTFYSPFVFGNGTAEFAATFTEFTDVLEQYCETVVGPAITTSAIPTMGEWGLISLGLLFMIIGAISVRQKTASVSF